MTMQSHSFAARAKRAAKIILDRGPAGSTFQGNANDIFLTSYPKSGNTWARFLLANALEYPNNADFTRIESLIPDIYKTKYSEIDKTNGPRIIKSHEPFSWFYRKVIYIVRDPRDVLISYYYHQKKMRKIEDSTTLEDYAKEFLTNPVPFGTWAQNVGSWLGARRGTEDFLLLRYEDMLEQPEESLEKMLSLLDEKISDEAIAEAVSRSDADRMRKLEAKQKNEWTATKNSRKDIPFVREARSGQWQDVLSPQTVDRISKAWATQMQAVGYST